MAEAGLAIGGSRAWHWFQYHFSFLPPHPFGRGIVDACTDCELRLPGLGSAFIKDIAAIGGKTKYEPHYDQLLQKLAEILVLRQLLSLPWPQGTSFEHEPAVSADGKRPELRVVTPDRQFLFEVKTPSLLEHAAARNRNPLQVTGRNLPQDHLEHIAGGQPMTLPRDNPVKDFLIDADKKFGQFNAVQHHTSALVIVWDDFIYEPITVLTHQQCGLLTPNSYFKGDDGTAVQFPNIDAVILVRHLNYFRQAAGGKPLHDRAHAFDFGDAHALPNVFIPIVPGEVLPQFVLDGLRALPLDAPACQHAAEYHPLDMVLWV